MNAYIDEDLDDIAFEVNLINFDEETLNVDESAIIRGRGRSRGSRGKKQQQAFDNIIRRELSQWELADRHVREHV